MARPSDSRRASTASSGMDMESPVTRSLRSPRFGGAGAPSSAGSNASGVTGATSPALAVAAELKPPAPPERSSSGDSHAVSVWATSASGRRSPIHAAGLATARTTERTGPGSSRSPVRRMDGPWQTTRMAAATKTATSPSRAPRRLVRGEMGGMTSSGSVTIRTGSR